MAATEALHEECAPEDADIFFHLFHRSLGIHLTMRCPLRCSHCSVHSGPERDETLDADLLLSRLEEIGRAGRIRRLCLSGGEPFLVRPLLLRILELAGRYGLVTVVNTAAHWAGTPERARNALRDFPGGVQLAVSADEYHRAFVPLENVRNALAASLERGLAASLVLRTWQGAEDPFAQELRAFLGEDIWSAVKLDIGVIKHVGRGEALPRRTPQKRVRPEQVCDTYCEYADQPVVDSDGTVLACCNTQGARGAPLLHLGHLERDQMAAMTAKADSDLVLQAIRVWGPATLGALLRDAGLADRLAPSYPDASICHLCTDIGSKPELVAFLARKLSEPGILAELAAARLLRYGEAMPGLAALADAEPA